MINKITNNRLQSESFEGNTNKSCLHRAKEWSEAQMLVIAILNVQCYSEVLNCYWAALCLSFRHIFYVNEHSAWGPLVTRMLPTFTLIFRITKMSKCLFDMMYWADFCRPLPRFPHSLLPHNKKSVSRASPLRIAHNGAHAVLEPQIRPP